MKLLGFVIFFNFDVSELMESISTYIEILDKLVIWKNSDSEALNTLNDEFKEKIVILGNGENCFIAEALNCAISYAQNNGFTHLLTMDQDSKFELFHAEKYRKIIESTSNNDVAIFCPLIISTKGLKEQRGEGIEKVYKNITSGSIYPLKVFSRVGKFREDLKIDYVDYEYSFRASKFGVDIYRVNEVVLLQEYGNIVKHRIGYTLGYSPLRLFFQTRNRIIVHNEYKDFGLSSLYPSLQLYAKLILKIVLYENNSSLKN